MTRLGSNGSESAADCNAKRTVYFDAAKRPSNWRENAMSPIIEFGAISALTAPHGRQTHGRPGRRKTTMLGQDQDDMIRAPQPDGPLETYINRDFYEEWQ